MRISLLRSFHGNGTRCKVIGTRSVLIETDGPNSASNLVFCESESVGNLPRCRRRVKTARNTPSAKMNSFKKSKGIRQELFLTRQSITKIYVLPGKFPNLKIYNLKLALFAFYILSRYLQYKANLLKKYSSL